TWQRSRPTSAGSEPPWSRLAERTVQDRHDEHQDGDDLRHHALPRGGPTQRTGVWLGVLRHGAHPSSLVKSVYPCARNTVLTPGSGDATSRLGKIPSPAPCRGGVPGKAGSANCRLFSQFCIVICSVITSCLEILQKGGGAPQRRAPPTAVARRLA